MQVPSCCGRPCPPGAVSKAQLTQLNWRGLCERSEETPQSIQTNTNQCDISVGRHHKENSLEEPGSLTGKVMQLSSYCSRPCPCLHPRPPGEVRSRAQLTQLNCDQSETQSIKTNTEQSDISVGGSNLGPIIAKCFHLKSQAHWQVVVQLSSDVHPITGNTRLGLN